MAKVVLRLPAKGIEVDYEVKEMPDGGVEIHIEPFFFQSNGGAPVAYLTTQDDNDKPICKSSLQVSGENGKYKLVDVTKKVSPKFAGKKSAPPKPPEEKPAGSKP